MSGIFSPKKPQEKPTVAMPDETDPMVVAAERKRKQGMMARGGRQSTILSGGAGGGSNMPSEYSSDKMG